ncbi:hypothetical protein EGW08_010468 [Elysia chlorotica]|uniref:Centriolar coiled-coil protein of 110 kDa n=1 Tax=Elysia chlorotica TaxID=188477 RepID=A0A3S1BDY6_ELYCH|nr:hypothetical protein EGW08_010468 [Elysia chlorotica]
MYIDRVAGSMGEASPAGRALLPVVAGEFDSRAAGSVSVQQLSQGVSITLLRVMISSPAGMGQLIKYFESQSKRLDKQSLAPHVSCLNSDYESVIKFNGVPILPPAITASRREELKQLKKNAVLLEKRHKARQRRQLMSKADSISSQPGITFPDTSPRPAARQLNFDSDADKRENLPERLGATNPVSCLATGEIPIGEEDFGLQTMDSVNSDFMSMEQSSIPKVFAGLALTSFKEQKISYDLDRLSKVLNVQDMASTSGSDLSDALGNTQTLEEDDLKDTNRLAQKFLQNAPDGRSGFFHESQDTVVEVSPEPGVQDRSSTSGFVDNSASSNMEQTQTSQGSSPGCGTGDSQRSSRSSPKSLKNAVHFASFLTEYNTTSSQIFERPMIVKKKMPYEQSIDHPVPDLSSEPVMPIIGDPSEARQRIANKSVEVDRGTNALLNKVALNPDSDSSPITPPFDPASGVPFQSYRKSNSSDKENDASQNHSASASGHSKSPDRPGRPSPKDKKSPDNVHRWASRRKTFENKFPAANSPDTLVRGYKSDDSSKDSPHQPEPQSQHHNSHLSGATAGVGPHELPSRSDQVGAGQAMSQPSSHTDTAPTPSITVSAGVATVGQSSVSDSQGSNKSGTLTGGTSESSSSTIREDLSARDRGTLAMNIVVAGHGSVSMETGHQAKTSSGSFPEKNDKDIIGHQNKDPNPNKGTTKASLSPKKLNTDQSSTPPAEESHPQDQEETPPRQFIRKGSYTLTEPSPALLKARAKYHEGISRQNISANSNEPPGGKLDTHGGGRGDSTSINTQSAKMIQAAGESRVQRKLPNVIKDAAELHRGSSMGNNSSRLSGSPEAEREGKAEHISKYLSQVQFQNSMNLSCQSWDAANQEAGADNRAIDKEVSKKKESEEAGDERVTRALHLLESEDSIAGHSSMLDVLKSLADSVQGSRDSGSVTELLSLHHQQMERERQSLIQQQQRDMEELFVQQRRDMLLLEAEIKAAQQFEKEQQDFLIENLPENIKVKARNHDGEYSPQHTGTFQQDDTQDPVHSADNRRPQSHHHRPTVPGNNSNNTEVTLQLQPKSFPGANSAKKIQRAKKISPYPLLKKGKVSPYSPRSAWEESQTHVKTVGDTSFSPRDYPTSLALPGYGPSTLSPCFRRPIMLNSPHKYSAMHSRDVKVTVPPEVLSGIFSLFFFLLHPGCLTFLFITTVIVLPEFNAFLILNIFLPYFQDTREFAFKFQTETPVKKGVFTPQDRALLERIVAQLQAALLDIHEIFFELPCVERMALIEQTRTKEYGKRVNMSRDSLRGSGPRISQATLKALERKRKAKEAEASVVSMVRPRSAPSSNSSPRCHNHTDVSGPLRRHFGFLISRALKPLQGQSQQKPEVSVAARQDSSRQVSEKERPRTAPAKQLTRPKRITALSSRQMNSPSTSSGETTKDPEKEGFSKPNSTTASKVVAKTKGASVKPVSNRPGKSWR